MTKKPLPQQGGSYVRDAKGGLKPAGSTTTKPEGKTPSKEG